MSSDIKYLTKELNDRIQDTKNMAQALRRVDELISDNRRLEVTIHILEHKIEAMGKHIKLQDKKGTIIMQRRSGLPNEPMLGAMPPWGNSAIQGSRSERKTIHSSWANLIRPKNKITAFSIRFLPKD